MIEIYKCLCDPTRLRILNLLAASPLCVCHLQRVLGKSQVLISQHLAYLRERHMVTSRRYRNWMIYALPEERSAALEANLRCLQDALPAEPIFRKDREKLQALLGSGDTQTLLDEGGCCLPPGKRAAP